MGEIIAYMVTWTTYGTWLQGDKRGWRKDGETYEEKPQLTKTNEIQMKNPAVTLGRTAKATVWEAIRKKAKERGQEILALSVWSNHVHIVIRYDEKKIEETVRILKNATTAALRKYGHKGRIWGGGYDKRFCFDEANLKARIRYVEGHGE